jgi:hypothetical protein
MKNRLVDESLNLTPADVAGRALIFDVMARHGAKNVETMSGEELSNRLEALESDEQRERFAEYTHIFDMLELEYRDYAYSMMATLANAQIVESYLTEISVYEIIRASAICRPLLTLEGMDPFVVSGYEDGLKPTGDREHDDMMIRMERTGAAVYVPLESMTHEDAVKVVTDANRPTILRQDTSLLESMTDDRLKHIGCLLKGARKEMKRLLSHRAAFMALDDMLNTTIADTITPPISDDVKHWIKLCNEDIDDLMTLTGRYSDTHGAESEAVRRFKTAIKKASIPHTPKYDLEGVTLADYATQNSVTALARRFGGGRA